MAFVVATGPGIRAGDICQVEFEQTFIKFIKKSILFLIFIYCTPLAG